MSPSTLRFIKRCDEFIAADEYLRVPRGTRGIYVLYKKRPRLNRYDVVYIGMSDSSVRQRLRAHRRRKGEHWSHFSVFEVWDNLTTAEIAELEGLFRHIYRTDTRANALNKQKGFKKLKGLKTDLGLW